MIRPIRTYGINKLPKYPDGGKVDKYAFSYDRWRRTLPENLQLESPNYNLKGWWESLGKPEKFEPFNYELYGGENDGVDGEFMYHASSRNPYTGETLKGKTHPTFYMGLDADRKAGYPTITKDRKAFTLDKFPDGGTIDYANLINNKWKTLPKTQPKPAVSTKPFTPNLKVNTNKVDNTRTAAAVIDPLGQNLINAKTPEEKAKAEADLLRRKYAENPASYDASIAAQYGIPEPGLEDASLEVLAVVDPLLAIGRGGAGLAAKQINNLGNKYLPNAYKLNPFAFKPNPKAYYRTLGKEGFNDAILSGSLRARVGGDGKESVLGVNMSRPSDVPYFAKGEIGNYPGNDIVAETLKPLYRRGDINPITGNQIKGRHWGYRNIDNSGYASNLPIEDVNFLQKDWLKGYREIPLPKKEIGGIINNNMKKPNRTYGTKPIKKYGFAGTIEDEENPFGNKRGFWVEDKQQEKEMLALGNNIFESYSSASSEGGVSRGSFKGTDAVKGGAQLANIAGDYLINESYGDTDGYFGEKYVTSDTTKRTAGSALKGAGTGASIGTLIFPGVGTAIGAGVGAIAGGIYGNSQAKKQNRLTNQALEKSKLAKTNYVNSGFTNRYNQLVSQGFNTSGNENVSMYFRGGKINNNSISKYPYGGGYRRKKINYDTDISLSTNQLMPNHTTRTSVMSTVPRSDMKFGMPHWETGIDIMPTNITSFNARHNLSKYPDAGTFVTGSLDAISGKEISGKYYRDDNTRDINRLNGVNPQNFHVEAPLDFTDYAASAGIGLGVHKPNFSGAAEFGMKYANKEFSPYMGTFLNARVPLRSRRGRDAGYLFGEFNSMFRPYVKDEGRKPITYISDGVIYDNQQGNHRADMREFPTRLSGVNIKAGYGYQGKDGLYGQAGAGLFYPNSTPSASLTVGRRFAYGGYIRKFPNGGNVPAQYEVEGEEIVQGEDVQLQGQQKIATDIHKAVGGTHEEGGVLGAGGERVFSNRLNPSSDLIQHLSALKVKVPKKATYAKVAELIGKKKAKSELKAKKGEDAISRNTGQEMSSRYSNLLDMTFEDQEMLKVILDNQMVQNGLTPQFADGGELEENLVLDEMPLDGDPKPKPKTKAGATYMQKLQEKKMLDTMAAITAKPQSNNEVYNITNSVLNKINNTYQEPQSFMPAESNLKIAEFKTNRVFEEKRKQDEVAKSNRSKTSTSPKIVGTGTIKPPKEIQDMTKEELKDWEDIVLNHVNDEYNVDGYVTHENFEKIKNTLKGLNLKPALSAAILANFTLESGLVPNKEEATKKSNKGYGIGQWTKERRTELFKFAKERKLDATKLDTQLQYFLYELSDESPKHFALNWRIKEKYGEKYGFDKGLKQSQLLAKLNTIEDPVDLAEIFMFAFERPNIAVSHLPERKGAAKKYLEYFNTDKYMYGGKIKKYKRGGEIVERISDSGAFDFGNIVNAAVYHQNLKNANKQVTGINRQTPEAAYMKSPNVLPYATYNIKKSFRNFSENIDRNVGNPQTSYGMKADAYAKSLNAINEATMSQYERDVNVNNSNMGITNRINEIRTSNINQDMADRASGYNTILTNRQNATNAFLQGVMKNMESKKAYNTESDRLAIAALDGGRGTSSRSLKALAGSIKDPALRKMILKQAEEAEKEEIKSKLKQDQKKEAEEG